jgi:hypothetical protein
MKMNDLPAIRLFRQYHRSIPGGLAVASSIRFGISTDKVYAAFSGRPRRIARESIEARHPGESRQRQ